MHWLRTWHPSRDPAPRIWQADDQRDLAEKEPPPSNREADADLIFNRYCRLRGSGVAAAASSSSSSSSSSPHPMYDAAPYVHIWPCVTPHTIYGSTARLEDASARGEAGFAGFLTNMIFGKAFLDSYSAGGVSARQVRAATLAPSRPCPRPPFSSPRALL
eukprot:6593626-Prymnesium_polylepis.1